MKFFAIWETKENNYQVQALTKEGPSRKEKGDTSVNEGWEAHSKLWPTVVWPAVSWTLWASSSESSRGTQSGCKDSRQKSQEIDDWGLSVQA